MPTEPTKDPRKRTPPYVAYKTFIGFVDSLRKAIPGRIDRSVMHTMSGGTQSHVSHALRTMDLINESGVPTEAFKNLINSLGEDRKKALAASLKTGYPFLFPPSKIDLATASGKQLLEEFENVGLRGDSIRRSIAFFLAAGKDAGITLSPFFNKIQSRSGTAKPRNGGAPEEDSSGTKGEIKKPASAKKRDDLDDSQPAWMERLLSKFPEFDPKWPDDIKTKWFEGFDRLMKGGT
jgi:hypothetical protein